MEAELEAEQDLSLASYDVLVQLAEAPDRMLRMTELADADFRGATLKLVNL